MTDSQLFQILAFLLQLATMVMAFLAKQQSSRNAETLKETNTAVKEVEKQTNHIKDELVASTAKASHAEGMAAQAKLEVEKDGPSARIFP